MNLKDEKSESSLLAAILKYGKDAYIDSSDILSPTDFSNHANRVIYTCFKSMTDDPNCEIFDCETVQMKANALGLGLNKNGIDYLNSLKNTNASKENIRAFAFHVKKYSVIRDLHSRYSQNKDFLENLNGNETLSDILQKAESTIVDFTNGIDESTALDTLNEDIGAYINRLMESEPKNQIGIPSGFAVWDKGFGSLRKGTVNVVASRSKVGKSFFALNVGANVSKMNIPVLYLDTELTKLMQQNRLLALESNVAIEKIETGKFKHNKESIEQVIEAGNKIKNWPFCYKTIAGMNHIDAINIIRRWLTKVVGFDNTGKANECLVIYDYIKIMNSEDIKSNISETMLLGFMMTALHDMAVRYDLPVLAFSQMNRDGIKSTDSSVVAASDRILWLASSLSFLINKTQEDADKGNGWEYGNKKIMIADCRSSAGFQDEDEYLNMFCSIRPQVALEEATGKFKEGYLYSQVVGNQC